MLMHVLKSVVSNSALKRTPQQSCSISLPGGAIFFVDGSSRGNPGSAGIGGVLCDDSRRIWGLFSNYIGFANAVTAEATAVLKACQLCYLSPILRRNLITIFTDSKQVADWANDDGIPEMEVDHIIGEIRSFLSLMHRVVVSFLPRGRISMADALAKKGSGSQEDLLIWDYE